LLLEVAGGKLGFVQTFANMSHKSVHQKWRLELFVKDRADAASCRQFLQENGIKRVNIPNKHKVCASTTGQ